MVATRTATRSPKTTLRPARDARILLVTAPQAAARSLADELVGARLAACVSVLRGVRSVYRWKGKVERATEALLVIKAPARSVRALVARLVKAHPYEVPECLVLRPEAGLLSYLDWIQEAAR